MRERPTRRPPSNSRPPSASSVRLSDASAGFPFVAPLSLQRVSGGFSRESRGAGVAKQDGHDANTIGQIHGETITMPFDKPIHRIAIVGTGVIGGSWAAQYLARGFDVVASDPAAGAEASLRKYVDEAWKELTVIGLSPGAARERLTFTSSLKEAVSSADFVQENGPERPDFKIKLFADMDEVTPPDSIIASSSSGLTMTVIQSGCKRPERCVIGHPFNPPHII